MIVDNVHIGGIGVSGTPTRIETCAQAGIDSSRIYSNNGRRRLKVAEGSNSDARF
jgi:hypothetical protein